MNGSNVTEKNYNHDIEIALASDYYEAYISVTLDPKAGSLTREQIDRAIAKKNVVQGIDKEILENIVKQQADVTNVLFATGHRHVNGRDGEIKYCFDTEDLGHPQVNQDGSVDFKNVNRYPFVERGDKLAVITLPVAPQNGLTVTGKTISPRAPKEARFRFGKNVKLSEDGLSLIAEVKGGIEFKSGVVSVVNVLTINGDVGVKTGNVAFSGKVIINGSITSGYCVEADEDVVVDGVVEAANVKTSGDLIVKGGILGKQEAKLEVGGSIIAKFLYSSDVICRGDITVDTIMHSNIDCQGKVVVTGKKSIIVGGKIVAWYGLKAGVIGSEMGTQTSLCLGLSGDMLNRFQTADDEIAEFEEAINKLDKVVRLLEVQIEQTADQSLTAKIEEAINSKQSYLARIESIKTAKQDIGRLIKKLDQVKLTANIAYQGVLIKMSNSFHRVKEVQKQLEVVSRNGKMEATYI